MRLEKTGSSRVSQKAIDGEKILGLAEVRWTGFGETTTDKVHKIWYCVKDSKHQWVALIGRKEVVGNIISCTPISSRLISI